MFEAAIPVLAVTDTTSGLFACLRRRADMMALSSRLFPVPGGLDGQPEMQRASSATYLLLQ